MILLKVMLERSSAGRVARGPAVLDISRNTTSCHEEAEWRPKANFSGAAFKAGAKTSLGHPPFKNYQGTQAAHPLTIF